MWENVGERLHKPLKVFPYGNGDEVMLFGSVVYRLKNGQQAAKDWAAYARFAKDAGGSLRMDFYQVYLDPMVGHNQRCPCT